MPGEINRILTDALSSYLFVTEKSGEENLLREGKGKGEIYFVGNVMIDSLLKARERASKSNILKRLRLDPRQYALLTLHRPSNVDVRENLENILNALVEIQKRIRVIYPIHPRTKKRMAEFGLMEKVERMERLSMVEPLRYLDFLKLMMEARFILTDSGGVQEETTFLGISCLTLRENTERPVTVTCGTNVVVGTDNGRIVEEGQKILNGDIRQGSIPKLWDGKAAKRIVDVILKENEIGHKGS
jgi:UDP-N-acetylglucosamine 2-epimerase (non-hydrolysing)